MALFLSQNRWMNDTDIHYLEIEELSRLIAARKVSPVEPSATGTAI